MRRLFLTLVGIVGLSCFGLGFVLTWTTPQWLETFAAGYIEDRVRERLDARIEAIEPPSAEGTLGQLAEQIVSRNQARIDDLKQSIRDQADASITTALDAVRDPECACRAALADNLERGFRFDLATLQAANDKLVELIQTQYLGVLAKLKQDVRIFTGSNALVFVVLLGLAFARPGALTHLFVPAVLLTISTAICSYGYLFGQNWLLTILTDSYLGWGYLGYLGIVFGFLVDIALNRGRITTEILNAIFEAIGAAASVAPC